ncbi:MAG: PQQ-dependent sugar dehydrogenase [Bacteroidota bacterium]
MKLFYLVWKNGCALFLFIVGCIFYSTGNAQPIIGFNSKISGLVKPVDVVNAGDLSKRLFVVEQGGTIKAYDELFNPLGDFLRVSDINTTGSERGLLSVAFPPNYASSGYFFVYYTNTNGDVELARYHTPSGTPNQAEPGSKQVVLTIPHPGQSNHNGGKLNFGSDGYLYFATGDGGGGGDQLNNAQNGGLLLGKMIRINVATSATGPLYTIPPDNPFLALNDNIMDEIWAFGLRNPFRWSFDRFTHDMWLADVGQDAWEEVNFRPAGSTGGLNYGWHCTEGFHPYNGGCALDAAKGVYAPPLLDYPHNNTTGGFAIIGGYVYRGTVNPAMYGYYIFADEVSHNVWLLPPNGTATDTIQFNNILTGISAFGEAENGELYVTSLNGQLYNVVASASGALPVKLVRFEATARTGYNEMNWVTADEQLLRQFDVEYSTDAIHFQLAGTLAAAGNGNYYFKHPLASTQKIYYRLKMTDLDGTGCYSKLLLVAANSLQANFVSPSVVTTGMLNLNLAAAFSGVQIINMEGRVLYSRSIANRVGRMAIPISGLPAGQYLVRLVGNEKQLSQKILVR